jgi:hypothetical protein
LPPDAGTTGKGDLTIEQLLQEKKTFDLALRFEKLGTEDGAEGGASWTTKGTVCCSDARSYALN